jgi:phospholipid N-methyltransferase
MDIQQYLNVAKKCPKSLMPDKEIIDFIYALSNGDLVEKINLKKLKQIASLTFRCEVVNCKLGFITPTLEWSRTIKEIIGDKIVLEVGAGTGLLAKYLNAIGVNIISTDNMSWLTKDFFNWELYFNVEKLDYIEAIKKYKTDFLLLCWPLLNDPMARNAASLFTKLNPDGQIIYIGEWSGCCADETFFENVRKIKEINNSLFPQWEAVYDKVYLLKWIGD